MQTAEFRSVLFMGAEGAVDREGFGEPDFFRDLHLDQLLALIESGRDQYRLAPFFYAPLHDPDAVGYRHEVLLDLERPGVRQAVLRFSAGLQEMRRRLSQVEQLHYRLQKQSLFVDAVEVYCDAVHSFAEVLGDAYLTSRGLTGLRDYVLTYSDSDSFVRLEAEVGEIKRTFAAVRYAVGIHGARVTVSRCDGEPDYGAQVEETFERFQQGAAGSYLATLPDYLEMNHVEAKILDCVARLQPQPFEKRASFCERHQDYLDATIARFDREVQFYLAYLELVERLREAGLAFCYPDVSDRSKQIAVSETFDIALAAKLVSEGKTVVCNEFHMDGPERIFVVSGPNNGGKTTFARTFGQLHYLASLGLPVPGSAARLFLPDRIYTHFEREEDIETLRGKFEDELVRVREIIEHATDNSIIVMNESFGSTSLEDARTVGARVMEKILDLDALGVYVSFVDELASLNEATVSIVSQVVPEDPAQRTFKVIRRPADGRAYAWAIAEKYGLSYDRLMERVGA